MKLLRIGLVFTIIAFQFSCNQLDKAYANKEIQFYDKSEYKNYYELSSKKIISVTDSLISPVEMEIVNNSIILLDSKSERACHVIDIEKEKHIGSFGKKGQGPGEILVPWKVSKKDNNSFIIYDVAGKKILGYEIDSITNGGSPFIEKKINEKGICSMVTMVDSTIYFTSDLTATNRIFKENTLNGTIEGYGELLNNYKKVADHNFGQACRGVMAVNKGKIVISYLYAPYFEIFNLADKKFKSILTIEKFPPIFNEIQLGDYKKFSTTLDTRLGFLDVSMTDKFIYLLYSGEKMVDHKNDEGKFILVFDYEGNPITQYKLDEFVTVFKVYNDKTIYAIKKDIKAELIKYDLHEN